MCFKVEKEHILGEGKGRAVMGSSRSAYFRESQEFTWVEMRDTEGIDESSV